MRVRDGREVMSSRAVQSARRSQLELLTLVGAKPQSATPPKVQTRSLEEFREPPLDQSCSPSLPPPFLFLLVSIGYGVCIIASHNMASAAPPAAPSSTSFKVRRLRRGIHCGPKLISCRTRRSLSPCGHPTFSLPEVRYV